MTVSDTEYDSDIFGLTCELAADVVDETKDIDPDKDADEVFEKWMSHSVQFYKCAFDKKHPLPESGRRSFRELVSKFDTMNHEVLP